MAIDWKRTGLAYDILTRAQREQKAKQQAMQDMFQQKIMEATIEKTIEQQDPMYQMRQKMISQYLPQEQLSQPNQMDINQVVGRPSFQRTNPLSLGLQKLALQKKMREQKLPITSTFGKFNNIKEQDYIINPNWVLTGKGDMLIENPAAQSQRKIEEQERTEANKPYSDVEAGVISKAELLGPKVDELIAMIEKPRNIYGPTPFGASRISAFGETGPWQSIKRGLTMGKGREAGILLQKVKTLAFGEGGKALTEPEKAIIMPLLSPAYKTEEQWVKDLKYVKSLLERKAQLLTKGTKKNVNIGGTQTNKLGKYTYR